MDVRSRTRRNLTPVVGGMTAMATATGAFAAVAHVAPAVAEQGSATPAVGAAGLAGAGTFESCSAYFGFGKDEGVLGVVEFDVADVSGDDDVAHQVDIDTTVRLVLENDEGDVLECVPFEITEEQWNEEYDDPSLPAYPGPGHYAYPSVNLDPFIDDFGTVVEVGFRVTSIPGEHTLVSPGDVDELDDLFVDPNAVFDHEIIDARVVDHIATEVTPDAADAYEAAVLACDAEGVFDGSDPDLLEALEALEVLLGEEGFVEGDADCFEIGILGAFGSYVLGAIASVEYVEEIRMALPAVEEDPTAPTAPPAAQPVTAVPQFTG